MSKVIPIETKEERDYAHTFWLALEDTTYAAPGWMVDESRVKEVIDRLERAISAYDRRTGYEE